MTTDSTAWSSGEPGIGERQTALRARHLGCVGSRFDDHRLRSRCDERAIRPDCYGRAVDADPERARRPFRPHLVARERGTAQAVDRRLVLDDREIDVESRAAVGELDRKSTRLNSSY